MSSFVMLVVALQITMGLYYFITIANDPRRHVLGWGIAFAKLGAGVLYPTLALLLLSSARRLATFLRRWHFVGRFINWDRSQHFHAVMAVTVLVFAVIHALSHLAGDFVRAVGSDSPLLPNFPHPITYRALIATRAGVTGIIALSFLLVMSATSLPSVRRSRFQLFQYTHLLMWPFIALLLVHGTGQLIARPVLGYWLIVPMLAVLWDRGMRCVNMLRPVAGCTFRVVQDKTLVVSIPQSSVGWSYKPGQYILIRVPAVSHGQWHPFTIVGTSTSGQPDGVAGELWIRQLGDWTSQLMETVVAQQQQQASSKADDVHNGKRTAKQQQLVVNLDGPFGSPADKLNHYQRVVIVGTGIGVTPYAGWLQDVRPQQNVDFHWVVRDRASFTWFSSLLNSLPLRWDVDGTAARGVVNIHTYATGLAPSTTLQHVCRVLLEKHRTITHPQSFITGLDCETRYGRPNIAHIFHLAQQPDSAALLIPLIDDEAAKGGRLSAEAQVASNDSSREPSEQPSDQQTDDATSADNSSLSFSRRTRQGVRSTALPTATDANAAGSSVKRASGTGGGSGGGLGKVGVFFCGPNYLGMEISDRCRMESLKGDTRFDFVGEVF